MPHMNDTNSVNELLKTILKGSVLLFLIGTYLFSCVSDAATHLVYLAVMSGR